MSKIGQPIFQGKLNKSNAREVIANSQFQIQSRLKAFPQNFAVYNPPAPRDYGPFFNAFLNADNTINRPIIDSKERLKYIDRDIFVSSAADTNGLAQILLPDQSRAGYTVGTIGKAYADDDYFEFKKQEADNAQYADFKTWQMSQIDFGNPVKREYWKKKQPELLAEAEKNLIFQNWLELQAYMISTRGYANEEEAFIIYMKDYGMDFNSKWLPLSIRGAFENYYQIFNHNKPSVGMGSNTVTPPYDESEEGPYRANEERRNLSASSTTEYRQNTGVNAPNRPIPPAPPRVEG